MPRALLALAVGAFGIGCTEFVIMGLLPQIASDLQVSVPAMGVLITAYALGVMIGAPTLTMLSAWLTTRQTLIVLMSIFVAGNALVAIAPTFPVMLAARVLTSIAHGAFFGVGAVAARRAVSPERATQAISLMFVGLTIANVAGVPLGTWVGQHFTWRFTFAAIAAIGVVTIVALRAFLPADQVRIDIRSELTAFRKPEVWLGLAITTVGFGSLFAVFSYVTPILTELSGLGPGGVTIVLSLFGLGTTVGTLAGGRFGDRWGLRAVAWGLAIVAVLLAAFTVTSAAAIPAVITLVLFGMVAFSLGPIVQNRIITIAGSGGSLVSAVNQGAFNIANAIGAGLGALVIEQGLGYRATMWVGSALAVAGALLVVYTLHFTAARSHSVRGASPAQARESALAG